MNIQNNFRSQKLFYIILLSILFIYSCSDKTINASYSKGELEKTTEEYASPDLPPYGSLDDPWNLDDDQIKRLANLIQHQMSPQQRDMCIFFLTGSISTSSNQQNKYKLKPVYDFENNYLSKSEKGLLYTSLYYLLSDYSIKNNLLFKSIIEHKNILEIGIAIAVDLQYGIDNNKILIDNSTYSDLKNLTKVYRQSENHNDIDPILDYLEADLEKYYNKPKAEIAADFGF